VTDLGILKPDPQSRELTLMTVHPGVTVEQARSATGWDLKVAPDLAATPAPTAAELNALRALHERTRRAHGEA
jgi:glutaconate CoA-transferase subunit B